MKFIRILITAVVALVTQLTNIGLADNPFSTTVRGDASHIGWEKPGAPMHLYFRGLHGIDRVVLRRNDSILGSNLRTRLGNAILYRGTLKKGGKLRPIAADIIGDTLKLRYSDHRGRPVVVKAQLKFGSSGLKASRIIASKFKKFPCGAPDTAAAEASVSSIAAGTGRLDFILPVLSPPRTLPLATYADYELLQRFGASTNAEIQGIVNAAAVTYLGEIGVSIQITSQHIFSSPTEVQVPLDSDGEVSPTVLLESFRELVLESTELPSGAATHLFTGKNLDQSIVGLSYLGQICRNNGVFSFGVTQHTGSASQAIIFAHELGHDFNATHTGVGEGIMSPIVSPSYNTFASTSLREISTFVNDFGACMQYSGSSISLRGTTVAGGQLKTTISMAGDAAADCTLGLYGSRQRPKRSSSVTQGQLLMAKAIPASGAINRKIPLKGRDRVRSYYLAARLICPLSTSAQSISTSQALTVRSSRAGFLRQASKALNR